jgi:hypothetical protein
MAKIVAIGAVEEGRAQPSHWLAWVAVVGLVGAMFVLTLRKPRRR